MDGIRAQKTCSISNDWIDGLINPKVVKNLLTGVLFLNSYKNHPLDEVI